MKVELLISPWYQAMCVDFPMLPEVGMKISLSNKDINKYIDIVKNADYPEEWGVKSAPDSIEADDRGFWDNLIVDTEVLEVNIVWNDDANAYIPQVVIDVYEDDDDWKDDDDDDWDFDDEDEKN